MPLYIMYFNLKDGVSEEEFVEKTKEFSSYQHSNFDEVGPLKLYKHHGFGANPRTYQMHSEFDEFGAWDRFLAFNEKDSTAGRLFHEWQSFIEMKTHYDEFVREITF